MRTQADSSPSGSAKRWLALPRLAATATPLGRVWPWVTSRHLTFRWMPVTRYMFSANAALRRCWKPFRTTRKVNACEPRSNSPEQIAKGKTMKILVAVKRVADPNVKVRVRTDRAGVDLSSVKMTINPFDEIAVEAAVRMKEQGLATEVVVVSCGLSASQETLRTALAMGADRAILMQTDAELQPLAVAKLLRSEE